MNDESTMTSYPGTESATHRALRNDDILQVVLHSAAVIYLGPHGYPRQREEAKEWRPTLANLARVCRLFYEPSCAVLWHTLDGVESILSFLPSSDRPLTVSCFPLAVC